MRFLNTISNRVTAFFVIFPVLAFAVQERPSDIEIRKINPPDLSSAHIGKKILCERPMRRGAPNLTIEKIGDKVVANNYGHGGGGWTLGPGIANYVDNLLIDSEYAKNLRKDTPITILGAGVIGLYSAYDLYQKGYRNLTIIAENFNNLTSHNAGGLLAPVSMDNTPGIKEVISTIGIDAYKFYASIANKTNPNFKSGAIIVPTYFENREDSGLEPYVGAVMSPAKDVILDFGNGTTRKLVVYDDGIFIDTAALMRELTNYLKSKQVVFKQQRITSFDQIKTKYIINCVGMGAAELKQDEDMIPVQGHLIMLKDQKPEEMQYMILVYGKQGVLDSGHKIKRSFYIFPKRLENTGPNDVGVLGGTFIEGATKDTPNTAEYETILQNANEFYGLEKP